LLYNNLYDKKYGLDDKNLTRAELALKRKEIEMNAHVDKELLKNPNKIPKAIYFM
jgi:hypothetical protein